MKFYLPLILFIFTGIHLNAQSKGKVLVISDADAEVIVDGDKQGSTTAGNGMKLELSSGEHYIQIQAIQNGKTVNAGELIVVESDKQKILKLSLAETANKSALPSSNALNGDTLLISNLDFTIDGILVVSSWQTEHEGETYPNYPKFYYVLDKGDELIIDFKMDNKKGTNTIKIIGYADGNALYSDNNLVMAKNLIVKIPAKGIYGIHFETYHMIDRSCNVRVRKIPGSPESKNLNPAVAWKIVSDTTFKTKMENVLVSTEYKAIQVQQPITSFVNSGSNATFKGGKSRIVIPVNLPPKTTEWYYIVSADRSEAGINKTMSGFKLMGQITNIIDKTGIAGLSIGLLTQPPGADYCDVYLLDYENQSKFEAKDPFTCSLEGTRENVVSGLVNIKSRCSGWQYIGLKNPDSMYGEFIAIEIVAITKEEKYEMQQKKLPVKISSKKIPVMSN